MKPVIPIEPVPQTVSLYEKRRKIQPRSVRGWFANWRWVMVWITQVVFYGLPWLPWNGRQSVLFDLAARRFYIFDLVLYPQDFIYLTGLLVLSAYGLFFFTAVGGQTIGKMATGIRVVSADDEPLDASSALWRTVSVALTMLTIGFGYLPALLGTDRRALHDRLARTRVVVRPPA